MDNFFKAELLNLNALSPYDAFLNGLNWLTFSKNSMQEV